MKLNKRRVFWLLLY